MAFIKTSQKGINKLLGNLKNTPQRTILPKWCNQQTAPNSRSKKSGESLAGRRSMYRATIKEFLLLEGSGAFVQKALPFHKRTFKNFYKKSELSSKPGPIKVQPGLNTPLFHIYRIRNKAGHCSRRRSTRYGIIGAHITLGPQRKRQTK